MSKTTAFWWAAVCASGALVFLAAHILPCLVPLVIAFACFGSVWLSKRRRDQRLIEEGRKARAATKQQIATPAMTSQGSTRLFVPAPLDDSGSH